MTRLSMKSNMSLEQTRDHAAQTIIMRSHILLRSNSIVWTAQNMNSSSFHSLCTSPNSNPILNDQQRCSWSMCLWPSRISLGATQHSRTCRVSVIWVSYLHFVSSFFTWTILKDLSPSLPSLVPNYFKVLPAHPYQHRWQTLYHHKE